MEVVRWSSGLLLPQCSLNLLVSWAGSPEVVLVPLSRDSWLGSAVILLYKQTEMINLWGQLKETVFPSSEEE